MSPLSTHLSKRDDLTRIHEMEAFTIRLERLIALGEDETPEGEQLREQMEAIWWQCPSQIQKRMEGLAIDLASLFAPCSAPTGQGIQDGASGVPARVEMAITTAAWDDALRYLRGRSTYAPHQVARLRSTAYDALGFHQAAALFAEQARQLEGQLTVTA